MSIYKIENPSDAYTLKADDPKVAQMATLLLGQGAYGLTDEQDNTVLPIFLLGGGSEWLAREFGDHKTWIAEHLAELADCLESVIIGGFSARRDVDDALSCMPEDQRADYLKRRHDRQRSSMNDIGQRAQELARALREKLSKGAMP